ncbi:putative ion-transport protein [Rhizocola hellebori]|uniref:Putative ion-transport protein n=1 Tax=Rhizocola hellebori TaxID=1392758 RepID=A0A8J3QBN5_9ACTN|nr:ion channel protein [Rhizocola hellebori]GIH06591.1 putative ion-transport protein [Rhizocola hellebori]
MRLLKQLVPAVVVGIASALVLWLVDYLADPLLHDLLWSHLPSWLDISSSSPWWIFAVLTATGAAVGLVVWLVPGHAGPNPATVDLMHPPGPIGEVPSLLLAAILALAGGVSLGPEFPVLGANAALAVALGARLTPRIPAASWAGLAMAATIGALFGAPIAAALMLTEAFAQNPSEEPLWDRLFAPLAAAAAGGLTYLAITGGSTMSLSLPPYPGFRWGDIVAACLIAVISSLIALAAIWVFPRLFALFQTLRHPMLMLTAGGIVLGVLGAIGGEITMFKGLDQMAELTKEYPTLSSASLAIIAGIKLIAMLVAATAGFRGGRIFPTVFIGVALGMLANSLFSSVPVGMAVACSILGLVLVITRSGWLAIFLAAVVVPNPSILVIICVAVLPAWLLTRGAREMIAGDTVAA